MLKKMGNFLKTPRGNLVENIIYLIIIGGLSYTFYTTKFQAPMNDNMDALNEKVSQWTNVEE